MELLNGSREGAAQHTTAQSVCLDNALQGSKECKLVGLGWVKVKHQLII